MRNILFAFLVLLVLTAGCLEEPVGTIVYEEVPVEASPGEDPLAMGRQIYQTYCQGCHAENGKGTGMPNQPDFTDAAFWASEKDEDLINSIADGVSNTAMPAWKDQLTEDEIREALKFIKSFSGLEGVVVEVEAPEMEAPATPAPAEAPAEETVVEEMPMEEEEHVHVEVPDEYAVFSENPYWHDAVADYENAKAEGPEIYVAKCQSCHGVKGLGEEETFIPGATSFADTAMIAEMSDAFWYWRIAEGISGTAMPAWKDQLTEDEIWMVMVYEHSFSHDESHLHEAHAEEEEATHVEEGHTH
ncbi:MAG: c-type cytochrome [Candidatus Hydrothermarchaeaceae archaeon]